VYHETLSAQDWNLIAQQQIDSKDRTTIETSVGSLRTNFENLSTGIIPSKQHSEEAPSQARSRPGQETIKNAASRHILHEHSDAKPRSKTNHTMDARSRRILATESNELMIDSDSDADLDDLLADQRLAFLLHDLEDAKEKGNRQRQEQLLQKIINERIHNNDQIKYSLELADIYAQNAKWAEAYSLANSLSISRDDTNNLVSKRYIQAEAALELGNTSDTENLCAKTIKLLRKNDSTKGFQHDFIYLLSRVAKLKCDQEQLRFYTFSLPSNYTPKQRKGYQSAEISDAEVIEKSSELFQCHKLRIIDNKVHGDPQSKYNAVLEAYRAKRHDVMKFLLAGSSEKIINTS